MKNEQTPGQRVSSRRKQLMKGIDGSLLVGDCLILPTGERGIYAGRYSINPDEKDVTVDYYIPESSIEGLANPRTRKMPAQVSIEHQTYKIRFQKVQRGEDLSAKV